MKVEYRVYWRREGLGKRFRLFATKKGATRWMWLLTNPEPWLAFDHKGDDFVCCQGERSECGCGGQTYRESFEQKSKGIPKLVDYGCQTREVGEWLP